MSIDALRGFDMIWILGAGTFVQGVAHVSHGAFAAFVDRQLEHVAWEGFHFYDLIYPLFVFLVGVSIVLSFESTRRIRSKRQLITRILRRGCVLFLLNFIFNGGFAYHWPHMRVASGVLALIAASYVIAALLYVFLADKLKVLAAVWLALLLGYWALLGLTPFPNFHLDKVTVENLAARAGSHDPKDIAAMVPERISGVYDEGRNFSNYVDFRFMPGRLLNGYYESQGLLSPITGAAVCLLGVFAGRLLIAGAFEPRKKVLILAVSGVAAIAVGLGWAEVFPIVKKLWSSSFCLVAGGCSALLLATFYYIVDVRQWRRWCVPFVWVGMNPIVLYVLSSLVDFHRIAERVAGGDVKDFFDRQSAGTGSAVQSLAAFLVVLLLARFLYQRKIFLKV